MTREELLELMANANVQIARMRAVADEPDIVLVVSRDVLRAMIERMYTEGQFYDFRTEMTAIYNGGMTAIYMGYPIAVVNEVEVTGMMQPAFRGMVFYAGMQLNDIIIVDDDNRLFRLENVAPIQYVDMGLTVRYDNIENEPPTATVRNTENIFADITRGYGVTINTPLNDVMERLADAWVNITTNVDEAAEAVSRLSPSGCSTPVMDTGELDAGNTKLIDDFLSGFSQKGFLQEAT